MGLFDTLGNLFGGEKKSSPTGLTGSSGQPFSFGQSQNTGLVGSGGQSAPVPNITPVDNRPMQGPQFGAVLPASTQQFGGGGAPAGGGVQQAPLEQAQEAPSLDFNSLIQPGLDALGQAEDAARGLFSAEEAGIEAGRAGAVGRAELAGKQGEQQISSQETRETGRAEGAVGEQRRGFAQTARNLAARFGSGISTGLGAEAIASRGALQNIAQIRTGLSDVINDLNTRRQSLQDITQNSVKEAENNAVAQKSSARAGLQSALADIGGRRGELQSRRAELVFQAVEGFRQTVADVNQRNTQFKQQLFAQQQQADQQLNAAIVRANQTADKLPSFELGEGQTKFLPTSSLGEGFGLPEGTDITQGTAGPFTTFSSPKTGDESAEDRIQRLFGE